jgi:hypothetical protein
VLTRASDVGNWNLVVNGGLCIAALAIADHNETVHSLASEVVSHAVSGMRHAFASYAPDGVWPGMHSLSLSFSHTKRQANATALYRCATTRGAGLLELWYSVCIVCDGVDANRPRAHVRACY